MIFQLLYPGALVGANKENLTQVEVNDVDESRIR
jgi:hypothetical protein